MKNAGLTLLGLIVMIFSAPVSANDIENLPGYAFKYTLETTASRARIWALWHDVENWKSFDERLEYSRLNADMKFENGATGVLKGKGAPKTKFVLRNVNAPQSFTETLKLPLGQRVDLERYFEETQNGTTVFVHEVRFRGALKALYYAILCKAFKKDLKLVMHEMQALAEDNQKDGP